MQKEKKYREHVIECNVIQMEGIDQDSNEYSMKSCIMNSADFRKREREREDQEL